MIYIVLGVSGTGKTTIGRALANTLNIPFFDADDFHPVSNIRKMKSGTPLRDEDRIPWLKSLAGQMVKWNNEGGAVLACSALKEQYRRVLQVMELEDELSYIFLNAEYDLIAERLKNRQGHFMNPDLLASQFEDLEKPKYGIHIDVSKTPNDILKEIMKKIK